MEKLAVLVHSQLRDTARFGLLAEHFEDLGYRVVMIDGDDNTGAARGKGALALPEHIEHARAHFSNRIDRVVVGTNRRDWALAWFRVFNRLADDFVWAADGSRIIPKNAADRAIARIAELGGADEEELLGQISVPLSGDAAALVIGRIARHPSYFRPLDAMDHKQRAPKGVVPKKYVVDGETIVIGPPNANALTYVIARGELAAPAVEALLRAPYTWPHVLAVLTNPNADPELRKVASALLPKIPKVGPGTRALADALDARETRTSITRIMAEIPRDSSEQAMTRLFDLLASKGATAQDRVMLGLSSIGFQGHYGAKLPPHSYGVRERFVSKGVDDLVARFAAPRAERKKNRIAFISMQLKKGLHAPTRNTISYVAHLRAAHPELEIAIFCSDDLTPSADERPFPNQLVSEASSTYAADHRDAFGPHGVTLHYSDPTSSRARRTLRDWRALTDFAPECVVAFGAELSPLRVLASRDYPILAVPMGGGSPSSGVCDVLATADGESLEQNWSATGLSLPSAFRKTSYGVDFLEPQRTMERNEIRSKNGDFIAVTVSNRLAAELAPPFLETMRTFLRETPHARWLIVGPVNEGSISHALPEVADRLRFLGFERDLPALYGICDAFANPFRVGGGHSVAIAMHARVPIVTLDSSRDAMGALGDTGGVPDVAAYVADLKALASDEATRKARGARMRTTVSKTLGFERGIRDFLALIEETTEIFANRSRVRRAA